MQFKVEKMLNDSLEQVIAKRVADMGSIAEARFEMEFVQLRLTADYLGKHSSKEFEDRAINSLKSLNPFAVIGMVKLDGESVYGPTISKRDFRQLSRAYQGNEIVDYCIGEGLLFAVPVMNGDNVRAVIYKLYDDQILTEHFRLTDHDPNTHIIIQERNGQIVVPYVNYGEADKTLFVDPTILEGFGKIRNKLTRNRSAAIYYKDSMGELFLFGADLPQTNCSIIGYVPWNAVAGNILRANIMIFIVTSSLLLLFLIASVYLFIINEKSKKASEAKKEADQANEAKSAFLANMSHEIRTPINAVIGMNEMILRECKDPTIIKYAQNAHAASESLLSLINDILDFSKIESGKMEIVDDDYHLDDMLKNLVTMIKPRAEKKGLEFRINVDENIPNELYGDSVRIRQVLVNFLTNAVKYTQVGSVDFNIEFANYNPPNLDVEIPEEDTLILLMFSVKDTGIGIREEDRIKLFKDFQRFDSKKNKNIDGTGLGLAITYKLVNMMHGNILVESVYGEGSTFTVIFPQKVVGDSVIGKFEEKLRSNNGKQEAYKASFIAPDAKILVVDDNEMNLVVATSLLKATQIQVDTAMSGMSALKKLAETQYDLVFLDQMMPSLDGIQTLKLAKEMEENKSQGVPMIVLTANAISGAKEMFLREGFTDYLSKPIDSKEMENMLMEYLPADKLQAPPIINEELRIMNEELNQEVQIERENKSEKVNYKYLNTELGLKYSAGMEDMYKNILTMFCNLKDEKKSKIQEAFKNEDWQNYTTFVHALKSTSLSIGGEQTSEAAKQLEMSGKILMAAATSELEKHEATEYIKTHHDEAMELYDKLVEEGRDYLNEELGIRNEELENKEIDQTKEEPSENIDSNSEYIENLQEAFENEDWVMYSIMLQEIKSDSPVLKQLDMACKMINADFTTDQEKEEAIKYIKENHAGLMELNK